ncbi:DUF433 domain-containing protein [Nitrosomonas communis]|uniref:DUF433 domain-containing protein n=1 Tax=Nitrosomonas communis TaxID=44574 RepID=UPI0026E96CDE|nr:DUF433 domain-containing protein [Nitrosomonas communis]MCO6428718.1 DUF433 domain-containing protein [Nitrosomonas communis]
MDWKDHIITDSNVLVGKPIVKGTRLSVEFLLGLKAAGWSDEQILENYPQLTAEDLQAVFAFAGALVKDEEFLPLEMVP